MDLPVMAFKDSAEWELWLSQNYTLQTGIWVKVAKKDSGIASVAIADALDGALCYGWIDDQRRSFDDTHYLQKYTPRRPRSMWSKVNIGKVEALIAEGRMQPQGQAAIDQAKADGRWEAAYESQANATVPPDLQTALDQNKTAKVFFETLNRTNQYAVLWRLMTAKTPQIRAKRLQNMVALLKAGKEIH